MTSTAAAPHPPETREPAIPALRRLEATGQPNTIDTVAREAGVSRSWLYGRPDLRAEVQRLRVRTAPATLPQSAAPIPARQRASEASLRQRLEAVNAEIRRLRQENQQLREQLAWARSEVRAAMGHRPAGQQAAAGRASSTTIGPCS